MSAGVAFRGQTGAASNVTRALLPFTLVLFLGYLAVGLPISTLPLQVHGLGYGTTIVGVAMGLAPVATLLTRQFAGSLADRRGPKFGVLVGLATAASSGIAYLLSTAVPPTPALGLLLLGRVVLGLGDSLFTTALTVWVVARVGPANAGRALAWNGIAMYGALAVGAPIGIVLSGFGGFPAVTGAVAVLPLVAIPLALMIAGVPAVTTQRRSILGVARAIWLPGLSMVLASGGVGTVSAFLALRYAELGWSGAGLALSAFGGVYIGSRLLFAGLPDRMGGVGVAMACLVGEAAGLALIAAAGSPVMAVVGSGLTGLGYSLVFPSLGVEVVRRVSPDDRGVALGTFLACFDLGLGAAGPVMGLVAAGHGLPASFLAASMACLVSMVLVGANRARAR